MHTGPAQECLIALNSMARDALKDGARDTARLLLTCEKTLAAEIEMLRESGPPRVTLDPHHARTRRALAEITGAARAVLKQIHEAGGWHVFDEHRQPTMQRAMAALEAATVAALEVPDIHADSNHDD
jgi:isopentenyl diphosphate isomerase/L-lactate dehydrogenase-like FMN-dependent dehydrogenase